MNDAPRTEGALTGAQLFVRALENEGVRYIFAVPGEENLDLLEALRESSIQLILNRHEQAAGFMAATYGRLTGRVGVCLSTLGPGATNLVTAAAYAQLGAMPMMMISGQKPIKSSKQGQFQILDVVDLMRPLTKYTPPSCGKPSAWRRRSALVPCIWSCQRISPRNWRRRTPISLPPAMPDAPPPAKKACSRPLT